MTSPAPLTEAEAAAAEVLASLYNRTIQALELGAPDFRAEQFAEAARAVVVAVRGPIEADVLDMAAEDLEQMAEQIRRTHTAAQPNRPGLQVAAEVLRGRAAAFRQSLSLPASKETP